MAIQQNFPDEGPTLNLNFAGSRTLDPRITFTRTSSATYMGSDGLIKIAPVNSPRFDHSYNPATSEIESLGLLIEEQRQNLLRRSEEFNDSLWGGPISDTGTVGVNSITSPDGTLTADKIIPGTNPARHYLQQILGITANTTYTVSCFAKAGGYNFASVIFGKGSTPFTRGGSIVNLTTGEITNYDVNSPTNVIRHTPINYGNGWWKISVSVLFDSTSTDGYVEIGCSSLATNYSGNSGDGISGIYVWGAQLEEGSFPTSYIPTSGSTATRTADNASMTGSNFSSWYNQSEGTIYVSQKLIAVQNTIRNNLVYLINGGSGTELFYNVGEGNKNIFVFGDGGTTYSRWQESGDSTDTKAIWAYDVSGDDFKPYWNGIEGVNETTTNTPSATSHTQLDIGANAGDKYTGHISRFTYYPTRLPNSQLQVLTR